MRIQRVDLLIALFFFPCVVHPQNLSPNSFGLSRAKSNVERYYVLLRTHKEAITAGQGVSYKGIVKLTIEIPPNASSIPLGDYTDFAGLKLTVINNKKNMALFTKAHKAKEVIVTKRNLGSGNYCRIKGLDKGIRLLAVMDKIPWINKRKGHGYGAIRRDVVLLKNGRAQNKLIRTYSTAASLPVAKYYEVDDKEKTFKNLHFVRQSGNKYVTNLVSVTGENNMVFSNITIDTPPSELNADRAIEINHSSNVTMEDITINGTYSQTNKYGYGISMNNVWNSKFVRLKASGNWGVFGNNNINTAIIEDSDINRFDIHCYGSDVYCKNTLFHDLYNQFSSFFGTLSFIGCRFVRFVPVLFESSYAAYTHFDLVVKDCEIEVDPERPYLIHAGRLETAEGARDEINQVQWPNVKMKNIRITADKTVKKFAVFQVGGRNDCKVGGIDTVNMENVIFTLSKPQVLFSNRAINTTKALKMKVVSSDFKTLVIKQ